MSSLIEEVGPDGIKWITFDPSKRIDFVELITDLCKKISEEDITLSENYTPSRFDLSNQVAISLGWQDKECVSIATLYKRDIYGNKVLRTMNRYWRSSKIRGKTIRSNKDNIYGLTIIPHHIKIAKENDYRSIFISRHEEARRYFNWLANVFNQHIGYDWKVTQNRVQVCNPATANTCWQYLIYCSLDGITIPDPVIKNDRI